MKPRLMLLGGFLGAGKSTLAVRSAELLARRGRRPAIVTNDQSTELVDTALAREAGIDVAEVGGGCFCCRFPDLLQAAAAAREAADADVIIAEAVGSCTDLVATVVRPLRRHYADRFDVAPLGIVVDPARLNAPMADIIDYLYRQQLLEADVVLLNKCDLLPPAQRETLVEKLQAAAAGARILAVSARTGEGLEEWLDLALGDTSAASRALDLDYRRYADAEAMLGWLNASGTLTAPAGFSINHWAAASLSALAEQLAREQFGVAHVKLLVQAGSEAAKASLTGDDGAISWDLRAAERKIQGAQFLLNARVCAAPDALEDCARRALEQALEASGARHAIRQWTCFSPPPPQPTYRL